MKLRPLPGSVLVKFFCKHGFTASSRRGTSHIVLRKPGCMRPLVIQDKREIPVFIILNNLRSAGIDREQFIKEVEEM
jgi:hypothetical protein